MVEVQSGEVRFTDVVLRMIVGEVGGEWRRDCLCDDKSSPLMHGPCRLVIPRSYQGYAVA